ncbi:hypothetical protein [Herbidospora sp. RD11066]
MRGSGKGITIATVVLLVLSAVLPSILLVAPFSLLGHNDTERLTAVLTFTGILVTGLVTSVGLFMNRGQSERQQRQLSLDAAMRAGQLIASGESDQTHPAALASGLLALTRLDQAELAVALLVDLWYVGSIEDDRLRGGAKPVAHMFRRGRMEKVSTETAILVIDAALRSGNPNAELVAAELLCRNSTGLDVAQSLDWPSSIDGSWNPSFSPGTKLLLVEALVFMTLASKPDEGALRSIAVRLYGIWLADRDKRVRGCVGKLIDALTNRLDELEHSEFVHGNRRVSFADLKRAARSRHDNPDGYLNKLANEATQNLQRWAGQCVTLPDGPGHFARAETRKNMSVAQWLSHVRLGVRADAGTSSRTEEDPS